MKFRLISLLAGALLVSVPCLGDPGEAGPLQAGPVQAGPIQAGPIQAGPFHKVVTSLGYSELLATFDESRIAAFLGEHATALDPGDRPAAALLVSLGALEAGETGRPGAAEIASLYADTLVSAHPALLGRFGDAAVYRQLPSAWQHAPLLETNPLQPALGQALADGVITGYDLRLRDVYVDAPAGLTFVYSQASVTHLRQLLALLQRESIGGWFYITPKVSAFLFREDWGPASDQVRTLPGGIRVVNGREIAAMFQFDTREDMSRFHEVITRYAKKDQKDEAGLIADAWWQPFYYSDTPFGNFPAISLVIVSAGDLEATLTVLEEKTESVVAAFADSGFDIRVDRVWVNPPFHRFLNGDYR